MLGGIAAVAVVVDLGDEDYGSQWLGDATETRDNE